MERERGRNRKNVYLESQNRQMRTVSQIMILSDENSHSDNNTFRTVSQIKIILKSEKRDNFLGFVTKKNNDNRRCYVLEFHDSPVSCYRRNDF